MPALIDDDLTLFGGRADWETNPVLSPDASGFDFLLKFVQDRLEPGSGDGQPHFAQGRGEELLFVEDVGRLSLVDSGHKEIVGGCARLNL